MSEIRASAALVLVFALSTCAGGARRPATLITDPAQALAAQQA